MKFLGTRLGLRQRPSGANAYCLHPRYRKSTVSEAVGAYEPVASANE
jgi:hypothetical protein